MRLETHGAGAEVHRNQCHNQIVLLQLGSNMKTLKYIFKTISMSVSYC